QFLQLFSMAVVLVGQSIGQAAYTRARKIVVVVILLAVMAGLAPVLQQARGGGYLALALKFRESQTGRILLAPFDVYGNIVTAPTLFSHHAMWIGVAALINGLLLLVVMKLDAHYLEAAATAGRAQYERIQRFRRGGGMSAMRPAIGARL